MPSRESLPLDAVEIGRNRDLWRSIPRAQALSESRTHTVAVIHRGLGRDTVTLFQPSNRFYRADGPYRYDGLRYFLYIGPDAGADPRLKKSLGMPSKPPETVMEPLEFEDPATGEFRSLGSPTAKVPKFPAPPKPPGLPSIPDAPALPELPPIPDIPDIPDLPTLQEFAIPLLSEKKLFPVEFQLVNAKGKPFPVTGFRVTLPDGSVREGKSGKDGFIRIPDNPQDGDAILELIKPGEFPQTQASTAAAASAAGAGAGAGAGAIATAAVPGGPEAAAKEGERNPIEIQLTGKDGKPMPGAAFRLSLPDGSVEEGKADKDGFIRFPDNTQVGEMELVLTEFASQGKA